MTLPNIFDYRTQTMTAQTTQLGKVKRDKNGNPLVSVRVKQSTSDKMRMIQRMLLLEEHWRTNPDVFPVGKHSYGLDPAKMTTEKVFSDMMDRVEGWASSTNKDIFEAFIVRHNALVDHLRRHADLFDPTGGDSHEIEMLLGIRKKTKHKRQPAVDSLLKSTYNDLFTQE